MFWLFISALIFLIGTIVLVGKIQNRSQERPEKVANKMIDPFEDALKERKEVLEALKKAALGYSKPESVDGLKSQMETIMAEQNPTEAKLFAAELEINALKRINQIACKMETSEPIKDTKTESNPRDFHPLFENYFRTLTPQACSELKGHAETLENLDFEIIKLGKIFGELNQSNEAIRTRLNRASSK